MPDMAFDFADIGDRMDDVNSAPAGNERGRALERLAADALSRLPGVSVVARNVLAASGVEEVDLLLANQAVDNGLAGMGFDVLVECKSQAGPVDARTIGWFAQQLRRRRAEWGILVLLSYVTGDRNSLTAGHREIERASVEGQNIIVLTGAEMRALRSAEHLIALLQRKRAALVSGYRTFIASPTQVRDLIPEGDRFGNRGWEAMRRAVRNERRRRVGDLIDAGLQLPVLDRAAALQRVNESFAALEADAALHADSDYDPMWLTNHQLLVAASAAVVQLFEPLPRTEEERRSIRFAVENSAPQQLRTHPGERLWRLLMEYYLDEARGAGSYARGKAAEAMLTLALDALLAIEDIEPPDAYDEH
jgi:hypothetical protein